MLSLRLRRKLLRLVRPRQQMVYAALMVGGLILELILIWLFLDRLHELVEALASERLLHPAGAEVLYKALANARYIMMGSSVILILISAYAGVTLSSRVYGPVVAFHRHVRRLIEGDYSSRVHLRRGDDLHDLRTVLNELAEVMEGRSGSL
jgi:signal transduction histidine kinase